MPCLKCANQPGYHSFIKFGKCNDANLFYTSPAKSKDFDDDGTKLSNVTIHVQEETEKKPWIWVMDCGNMTFANYTEMQFNAGIANLVSSDPMLQEVWIVRSNVWIRTTIAFFQAFSSAKIFERIYYIDGSPLEQLEILQKKGVDSNIANWLIQQ